MADRSKIDLLPDRGERTSVKLTAKNQVSLLNATTVGHSHESRADEIRERLDKQVITEEDVELAIEWARGGGRDRRQSACG